MQITIKSISKEIDVSENSIRDRIRIAIGDLPKVIDEEFKQKVIKEFNDRPAKKHLGRLDPNSEIYYLKAKTIIEKDGYITQSNLIKEFKNKNLYSVLQTFDRYYNDLYEDKIVMINPKTKTVIKTIKVYRFLNKVFDMWKTEVKHKPNKNGYVQNQSRGVR